MTEAESELIDQYLFNKLEGSELEVFVRKMETDESFRNLVKERERILAGLIIAKRKSIINQFESLDQETSKQIIPLYKRPIFYIAASITFILMTYFIFQISKSEEGIYLKHYKPYLNLKMITSRSSDFSLKSEIYELYKLGEYSKAKKLIEEEDFVNSDQEVFLMRGLLKLEFEEFNQAAELFEMALKLQGDQRNATLYYLSLTYIRLNKIKSAESKLHELVSSENEFKEDALKILNELK